MHLEEPKLHRIFLSLVDVGKPTDCLSVRQTLMEINVNGWGARLIFTHKLQPDHGFMLQGNQISRCVHLNTAVALSPSCLNAFKTKHRLCPLLHSY